MSHSRIDEEKYSGPSLHDAPELVVTSGPSGPMTSNQERKRRAPEYHDVQGAPQTLQPYVRIAPNTAANRMNMMPTSSGPSTSAPVKVTRMTADGKEMDFDEDAIARYKEIGRLICELDITDFHYENHLRTDRRAFMIASRGEEILTAVRRNLAVIAEKLGDLAEGTIFAHGDELATSFADSNPESLQRLNQRVAAKLKARAEAAALNARISQGASAPSTSSVKTEEPEVKAEPLDDYHF